MRALSCSSISPRRRRNCARCTRHGTQPRQRRKTSTSGLSRQRSAKWTGWPEVSRRVRLGALPPCLILPNVAQATAAGKPRWPVALRRAKTPSVTVESRGR
jgi:hypothetical protein